MGKDDRAPATSFTVVAWHTHHDRPRHRASDGLGLAVAWEAARSTACSLNARDTMRSRVGTLNGPYTTTQSILRLFEVISNRVLGIEQQ